MRRSKRLGLDLYTVISGAAGRVYPPLHPSIISDYVVATPGARVDLFPVRFDVKQAEVLSTLFLDGKSTRIAAEPHSEAIPVFLSTSGKFAEDFCRNLPTVSIVLDLHDGPFGVDTVDLPTEVCAAIRRHGLQVVYLKLQVHDPKAVAKANPLPTAVHLLSLPLLPGGSRYHITCQTDFVGDRRFRLTLADNPAPVYSYDWSWVGGDTCSDRHRAFELLSPYTSRSRRLAITTPGHQEAGSATVPIDEYIAVSRGSRVCLSLNGNGPWCLKDGELLANHCMILRQHHPSLFLNPLSPINGKHWTIAKTDDLTGAIEHLIEHPEERERIRNAGHDYFKDALINRTWATYYAERLHKFLTARTKEAWGSLAIG